MAKKNDNTLLWVGVLGVGAYLYYQFQQSQISPATPAPVTATPAPVNQPLQLPPASVAPPVIVQSVNQPLAVQPKPVVVPVIVTPTKATTSNIVITPAVAATLTPITTPGAAPETFTLSNDYVINTNDAELEEMENMDYPGAKTSGYYDNDKGECL